MPEELERANALQEARELYAKHSWQGAFEALRGLDEEEELATPDLEKLVWSGALVGDEKAYLQHLERLYHRHVDAETSLAAARSAFWLGFRLMTLGESARGAAWLGRSQQLVDAHAQDCVEAGYLLLAPIQRQLMAGDLSSAADTASRAAAIGEKFSEPDLVALGRQLEGRALIQSGRVDEGMALLDESMLAAASGELSPIVTGIVYCSLIASCQRVFALGRAREWTAALSKWCEAQPELVTFRGSCQVHRSEILQLAGEWRKALAHAERASTGPLAEVDSGVAGDAFYVQGEIHRLRGEMQEAEDAYHQSSKLGREPQPGLAQLRAAQGRHRVALTGLRRVLGETRDILARARLLPAFLEICLDQEELEEAEEAAAELERIASRYPSEILGAISAQARGSLSLARGDAQGALGPLRHAFYIWQRLGAPYEEARLRLALSRACHALGDAEGARLSLDTARAIFEQLGAAADLAALDGSRSAGGSAHSLTPRELEVLRLVAKGMTNRAIAEELRLSEKTIDRHVSNIFNKIDVPSRAAATAYAYEHGLI
jgi:DNA-binding CsgD family transcriptional regulator